ncbi:MAG: hypothetical protein ACFUZC_11290 [Chthoniobacteraceae bacterium]
MDIDTLLKSVAPIAGLVAAIPAALIGAGTLYLHRCSQKTQSSKIELDAVQSAITVFSEDTGLRGFLQDVQKEKLCQLMFGCPIPIGAIGRLIAYYRQGFATTSEICSAWEHRNEAPNPLSFQLGWFENAMVIGIWLYSFFCGVAGILAFGCAYVAAFFAHNFSSAAYFAAMALFLVVVAVGSKKVNRR